MSIAPADDVSTLLALPGLVPEAKLFLIALAHCGDADAAERLIEVPLPSAVRWWLDEIGLVTPQGGLAWDAVARYAARRPEVRTA